MAPNFIYKLYKHSYILYITKGYKVAKLAKRLKDYKIINTKKIITSDICIDRGDSQLNNSPSFVKIG